MARFKEMTVAVGVPTVGPNPIPSDEQRSVGDTAVVVARDAVRRAPTPPPDQHAALRWAQQPSENPVPRAGGRLVESATAGTVTSTPRREGQ